MAWEGSSKPRRAGGWPWTRRCICTTPAGPTPRWGIARRKRRTAWRHESMQGSKGETDKTRPGEQAAVAPLRGYAPARGLACAPPRSGATNPQRQRRKTPDTLSNLSQDLTFLFSPAVRRMKEIVDAGDIGEVQYI